MRESVVAGRPVVEVVTQLGYPLYVLRILGILKLAGAVVLFVPRLPRLKEWAYAGVTFELTGAAASHVLRGNGARDHHVSDPGGVRARRAARSGLSR